MKKYLFTLIVFLSCFPFFSKEIGLEQTISDAAVGLGGVIDGKVKTVAVLDIRSEYWALSDYIVNELNHELTNTLENTNVAERDEYSLALIQKESDYQLSGAVSDETIQEIGEALGADCIILGNMETVSGGWQLILRASTVESKKVLSSWKGKISNKEKEVKFQIEKSKKTRPVYSIPENRVKKSSSGSSSGNSTLKKNELGISISMINEDGNQVSVLHPGDVIRFKVSSDKNAYLAILCTDAQKDETWLPLQNNFIRAGESRVFPDIPGAVLRVEDGIFGNESVKVYAATVESDLPTQGKMMGTRAFKLTNENSQTAEALVEYRVER